MKRTSTLGMSAPREPVIAGSRCAVLAEWILEPRAKRPCRIKVFIPSLDSSYTLRVFLVIGTKGIVGHKLLLRYE
jgi:hypothetical protein